MKNRTKGILCVTPIILMSSCLLSFMVHKSSWESVFRAFAIVLMGGCIGALTAKGITYLTKRDRDKETAEIRTKFVLAGRSMTDWIKQRCDAEERYHHGQIDHDVREKTKELNDKLVEVRVECAGWKAKAEAFEKILDSFQFNMEEDNGKE